MNTPTIPDGIDEGFNFFEGPLWTPGSGIILPTQNQGGADSEILNFSTDPAGDVTLSITDSSGGGLEPLTLTSNADGTIAGWTAGTSAGLELVGEDITNSDGSMTDTLDGLNSGGSQLFSVATDVSASGDTSVTISGSVGDFNIDNASITLESGAEAYIVGDDNSFTLDGSNTLYASGAGGTISGSGDTIDLGAYSSLDLTGNHDTIVLTTGDDFTLSGTNDLVKHDVDSDSVTLDGYESKATVDGYGGYVDILGNDDILHASNKYIDVAKDVEFTGYGSYNDYTLASHDALLAYGSGNGVYGKAGDYVFIGNTNGVADDLYISNDLSGGSSAGGYGTGIDMSASAQANITGSNDDISEANDDILSLNGSDNALDVSGSSQADVTGDGNDIVGSSGPIDAQGRSVRDVILAPTTAAAEPWAVLGRVEQIYRTVRRGNSSLDIN